MSGIEPVVIVVVGGGVLLCCFKDGVCESANLLRKPGEGTRAGAATTVYRKKATQKLQKSVKTDRRDCCFITPFLKSNMLWQEET